ncbi:MAG: sensor histidine kinase [Actinomycetota bacterium]
MDQRSAVPVARVGGRPPEGSPSHPVTIREAAEFEATRLEDLRRSEQVMVLVRALAAVFAFAQVLVYSAMPYPPGVEATGLALAGALALVNLVIWVAVRRTGTLRRMRRLSLAILALDILVASGFVFLYAFDQVSALWAILYVLPLEGAIRFQLPGSLGTWAAVTGLYTLREVWGSTRYDYLLEWNSITFRMGLALLIALVAGLMARNLRQQHSRLQDALAQLRRVDELRSNLVSTLAHDVRNPLFTIRGTLRMLMAHPERLSDETVKELLRAAEHQAARMERLAIDLLDLARLETGRMELHLQRILVREAVERALSYADRDERFEIRIEPDVEIMADPGRFEQIVVNLAMNAIQHGAPPFVIEGRRANGFVTMDFLDAGPGVPRDERESLFEPFRTEQSGESVGFGLAIVRALAEAHGGGVAYLPTEPRGACFRVTLPATR